MTTGGLNQPTGNFCVATELRMLFILYKVQGSGKGEA